MYYNRNFKWALSRALSDSPYDYNTVESALKRRLPSYETGSLSLWLNGDACPDAASLLELLYICRADIYAFTDRLLSDELAPY